MALYIPKPSIRYNLSKSVTPGSALHSPFSGSTWSGYLRDTWTTSTGSSRFIAAAPLRGSLRLPSSSESFIHNLLLCSKWSCKLGIPSLQLGKGTANTHSTWKFNSSTWGSLANYQFLPRLWNDMVHTVNSVKSSCLLLNAFIAVLNLDQVIHRHSPWLNHWRYIDHTHHYFSY